MDTFPKAFEQRMRIQLGAEAGDFLDALRQPSPVSIRVNPGKVSEVGGLEVMEQACGEVAWCRHGYYLSRRPVFTLDPCLHGGAYYVQEASSMFLAQVLRQVLLDVPVRMLDLCAAPGGKSTLSAAVLPAGSLLVSNEYVRSRAMILKENMIKWGQDNVVVTNNAAADFAELGSVFDVILVDAPCSGEGMFRKDAGAIGEWSEQNVRMCCERQRQILADVWDALVPGGVLIYSTCTYNRLENEEVLKWLVEEYGAESLAVEHSFDGVVAGDSPVHGYHFYPHRIQGEGFFIGAVRKGDGRVMAPRKEKRQKASKSVVLPPEVGAYVREPGRYAAYRTAEAWGVVPAEHAGFVEELDRRLCVLYKGCELAEAESHKLKLLPASALWKGLAREHCVSYEADRTTALAFLKKEDIPAPGISGDWLLVTYRGLPLGWCKNLGNRLNNYYPKEWRIRMQIDAGREK